MKRTFSHVQNFFVKSNVTHKCIIKIFKMFQLNEQLYFKKVFIVKDVCPVSQNASFESADRGEISQLWQELRLYYLAIFDKFLLFFHEEQGR